VERTAPPGAPKGGAGASATDPSVGATESKVDMRNTVPQHFDRKGTKIEDLAGTGEHDSQGG